MKRPNRKNMYVVVTQTSMMGSQNTTWLYYHGSPNWYPCSDRRVEGHGNITANLIERISLEIIKESGIPFPVNNAGETVSVCFRYRPFTSELTLCRSKERKGW